MSKTPMHNRFVEGFLEPHSWGQSLDALSTRIRPTPFVDLELEEFHRRARIARNAAIAAATVAAGRELRALIRAINPIKPVLDRWRAWRARERAADELYALDERTLAELGLRRADIPFVAAGGSPMLDRPPTERTAPPQAANGNRDSRRAA
jgi:uncharacterized protein YjiS (DUF1127 family)